ncbi:hypothetical protein [Sphingobacterium daejeonense]|uniref:hypothetical protein n=1 Tax=Sphingobacterium daejeonense TaxID=371142 RepID=UPI0010C3544F|nr:hypothetical protein [Sphingobacterium daejeonense]VTQ01654.1 Uncharacterised protein [Sphingobacterium daejeonense]
MLDIVQMPQPINYSQSVPDLKFTTEGTSVQLTLQLNWVNIVIENYDAPPTGTVMTIKLKELIENFMTYSLPVFAQDITVHEEGVKNFKFILDDVGSAEMWDFKVIKGYLRPQPFDLASYLRDFWLNLVPKHSEVYFHQPLYLTALPPADVTVKITAKMVDGSDKTISVGQMVAGKLQSVNLNPGKMVQLLGGKYIYFEAYTVDSSDSIVTGLKRFYFRDHYEFNSDVFFYQNRLGGWDTLVLNGQRINRHQNTASTAVFDEREFEYQNDLRFEIEKDSGFISTEEQYKQYVDFLFSRNKYYLFEGSLIPIVTSENKTDHTKGKLNSYTFIFRPSNTKQVNPEIGSVPTHLIIT